MAFNQDKQMFGYILKEQGFETWFRYMFKIVEGRKFIKEPIHQDLFDYFEKIHNLSITRGSINIPPRSAKTTLAKYFIAYCWAINPNCNFIYTSYSQELLNDISRQLAGILEHPVYKEMYPNENITIEEKQENPVDDFWRDILYTQEGKAKYTSRKIITASGGICLFSAIGATITGLGCLDFDTLVKTDKGFYKIGDIVEKQLPVCVYSYDFKNKKYVKTKIDKFIKNEEQLFYNITLDNGEIIRATNDHIFFTDKGKLRVDFLKVGYNVMSKPFNLMYTYSIFFANIFSAIVFIYNKTSIFFCKFFKKVINKLFSSSLVSKLFGNYRPNTTAFNVANTTIRYSIFNRYCFVVSSIFGDSCSLLKIKFLKFPVLIKFIYCVFSRSSITKIFNSIVSWVSVYMASFKRRFSYKSFQRKSMNRISFFTTKYHKRHFFITLYRNLFFNNFFTLIRENASAFRNKISFKIRNRKIVNIVKCNHNTPSYCLSVWGYNNFLITKSQVISHNCGVRGAKDFSGMCFIDDAEKPSDIHSETIRKKTKIFFSETLLSRLNESNVPILNIQQRLHVDDFSSYLESTYNFDVIKKPLIENGVCQIPSQYTEQRLEELKKDNYVFSAQYQQEPVIRGGSLIKIADFKTYNELPQKFDDIFIVADTAFSEKKMADNSAFLLCGNVGNNLYLIDGYCRKVGFTDLRKDLKGFYNKAMNYTKYSSFSSVYIENKASGISLIQVLRSEDGLPIKEVYPKTDGSAKNDKYSRFLEIESDIISGYLHIPNMSGGWIDDFVSQCEAFDGGKQVQKDDMVDCLIYALKVRRKNKQIDWGYVNNVFR